MGFPSHGHLGCEPVRAGRKRAALQLGMHGDCNVRALRTRCPRGALPASKPTALPAGAMACTEDDITLYGNTGSHPTIDCQQAYLRKPCSLVLRWLVCRWGMGMCCARLYSRFPCFPLAFECMSESVCMLTAAHSACSPIRVTESSNLAPRRCCALPFDLSVNIFRQ